MITEVPDEAYDTPKDSSTKLTFENTLMSYTKRDITKNLCKALYTSSALKILLRY